MADTDRRSVYRRAWAYPAARWLTVAAAQSRLGDFMYSVALYALIFSRTHSASYVAVAAVLTRIPLVVLPAVAGALADRVPRRPLMVGLDAARFAVAAGMAGLVAGHAPVAVIVAAAAVLSSLSTPYGPAQVGYIASVVAEDDLAAVNAVTMSTESLALLVGPAVGAALLVVASPTVVFLADAVTFMISMLCLLRLPASPARPARPAGSDDGALLAGFRALVSDARLTIVTAALVATCITVGATTVLYLVVATDRIGVGPHGYGYLLAVNGLGGLIATAFAGRVTGPRQVITSAAVTLVVIAATVVGLAHVSSLAAALVVTSVYGAAYMLQELMSVTLLQRCVDNAVMGRASAAVDMLAFGGVLLGAGLAGPLVQHAGLGTATLVLAAPALAAAGLIVIRAGSLNRRAQQTSVALDPAIALLRRVSALTGADRLAFEALAAQLVMVEVAAGTTVIHEGAVADYLYVVEAGTLHASTTDPATRRTERIRSFGPGDLFGEIGLIQQRPRTADVVAMSDARIGRLVGEEFLAAVGALPQVSADLAALAATRLRRGLTDTFGV